MSAEKVSEDLQRASSVFCTENLARLRISLLMIVIGQQAPCAVISRTATKSAWLFYGNFVNITMPLRKRVPFIAAVFSKCSNVSMNALSC
jgi:hypothetical protein